MKLNCSRVWVRKGVVLTLLLASLSLFPKEIATAAATVGAVTNSNQSTGGGGTNVTSDCTSNRILQNVQVQATTFGGYATLTYLRANCFSLQSSGLLTDVYQNQLGTYGGVGDGVNLSAQCGVGGTSTSIVGADVYKNGGGYVTGIRIICGTLPTGSSQSSGTLLGNATGTPNELRCDSGTIAVGLNIRYGGILDGFGLRCAPVQGATQSTVSVSVSPTSAAYTGSAFTASLTITGSGGSGTGSFSYSTSTPACTLTGTTLTSTASGNCAIVATKASDTNYAAQTGSTTFTFIRANQSPITVVTLNVSSKVYPYSQSLSVTSVTGGSGTGALTVTSASNGTASGCTLTSTTLTASTSGTCNVTITKAATTYYNAETATTAFTFVKANQSALTITSSSVTMGETLAVTTTGGTGSGAITIEQVSGECSTSGLVLTPTAVGNCVIKATKSTDSNYLETSTTKTITISPRALTIKAADKGATYTGSSVAVSNSYSITSGSLIGSDSISSLTYRYTSTAGYNSTSAPSEAGTYTITPSSAALSPGDTSHYIFSYETGTLTISKASQIITFSSLANKTLGMDSFTVSASTTSNLPVTFTSATTSQCTVAGTSVTLVAAGTCTINANQSGNDNFEAASQVQQSFTISATLMITTPSSGLTATYNSAFSLAISTSGGSGGKTFALASGSLPAGLALNSSTGTISGTPMTPGSQSITIRVTDSNTATATTSSFTILVNKATQAISITTLGITTKAYPYSQALAIITSTTLGSGAITFSTSNSSATGCSLSDTTSTTAILSASTSGTCNVRATIAADTFYESSTSGSRVFTFQKAAQASLSITSDAVNYGETLTLVTSGGSGTGALTFKKNSGNCTLSGTTLTPTAVGSCSITANKATDTNYLAETSTARTITISLGNFSASLTFASSTLIFGTLNNITISATTPGDVLFRANGRIIKSCKSKATSLSSPYVATCAYRPATRRPITISATLDPTDDGYAVKTTTTAVFNVQRRSGNR